ncbi:MAG: hypothetical protein AAFO95_13190, partial [Cyanobacteria bacterium J06600_6]
MLISENFGRKFGLNHFYRLNLRLLAFPILAIAISLIELQSLNAAESNQQTSNGNQKVSRADAADLLKISFPSPQSSLLAQVEVDTSEQTVTSLNDNVPEQIVVKDFDVVGSSIFSEQELNQAVK